MKNWWYQREILEKVLLSALLGMAVLFFPVYLFLSRQAGVGFYDALLVRHDQGAGVSYAGRARGQRVEFQVSGDGAVTYVVDGQARGPYTVVLDQTAAPDDFLTGGEVRLGEEVLFRGGWMLDGGIPYLEDASGVPQLEQFFVEAQRGGEQPLPRDPSAAFLVQLVQAPDLRHRGQWQGYVLGTVLALAAAGLIIWADKLFRWNLRWSIRNPEEAEPSDWELFTRKLSWVLFSGMALALYIIGAVTF